MYLIYICVCMYMHVCSGVGISVLGMTRIYNYSFLDAILSFLPCFCMCILELGMDFQFAVQKNKNWGPLLKGRLRASRYKITLLNQEQMCPKKLEFQVATVTRLWSWAVIENTKSRTSASNACSCHCFPPAYHCLMTEPDANFMLQSGTYQAFGYACQFGEEGSKHTCTTHAAAD